MTAAAQQKTGPREMEIWPVPGKDAVMDRLSQQLTKARTLRDLARSRPAGAEARLHLRTWQSRRLAWTHADLLADPQFAQAARFFLTDLYSPTDFGRFDTEVDRVVPVAMKLLPADGLETLADAVELDALSEDLDAAMLQALGTKIEALDGAAYSDAYREVGRRADRERQIQLVEGLGHLLDRLTHLPFIAHALMLMRGPARLASLGGLQDFLQRGFAAVNEMNGIDEFLGRITTRELRLMEDLFAGDDPLLHFTGMAE